MPGKGGAAFDFLDRELSAAFPASLGVASTLGLDWDFSRVRLLRSEGAAGSSTSSSSCGAFRASFVAALRNLRIYKKKGCRAWL